MSENLQMNTEKEGYVCPHCRILFTLPKSLGGNGAQCPGCDKLLTMPSPEDGVTRQGVSKVSYQQAGLSSLEISHNEAIKEGQWNNQRRGEISRFENSDKALRWMLPIGLTAVMVLAGLVYVLLSTNDNPVDRPDIVNTSFGEEKEVIRFDHQNLEHEKKLKAYLDKMYAAKTVDELLPYCRKTNGLREKMVNFYKGDRIESKEIKEVTGTSDYGRKSGFISFKADTTDYGLELGLIEYKDGVFNLDWESYVAYSEMSWKEMKRLKPIEPIVLRLVITESDYYNEDFSDEKRWQSLRVY